MIQKSDDIERPTVPRPPCRSQHPVADARISIMAPRPEGSKIGSETSLRAMRLHPIENIAKSHLLTDEFHISISAC
jgi:hypothetical protein